MNNDNFLIEERDLEQARDICKYITDSDVRNRAVANVLAGNIAEKYFTEVSVDTKTGLHNIAAVLKDLEISDIYINKCYVDVRLYFNDNELFVPKDLFDRNLLPLAFMFIKITPDLSGGTVSGFVLPEEIDTSKSYNGYYKVNETDLVSFYEVESILIDKQSAEFIDDIDSKVFAYLDGTLEDVNGFYRELLSSEDARIKLAIAAKAQDTFAAIKVTGNNTSEPSSTEQFNDSGENDLTLSNGFEASSLDIGLEPSDEVTNLDMDGSENISLKEIGTDSLIEPVISLEESDELHIEELEPAEDILEETGGFEELQNFENDTTDSSEISILQDNNFTNDSNEELVQDEQDDNITIGLVNDNYSVDNMDLAVDETASEYEEISIAENDEDAADLQIVEDYNPAQAVKEISEPEVNVSTEQEATEFEYSTEVTPSITAIEDQEVDVNNLEDMLDEEDTSINSSAEEANSSDGTEAPEDEEQSPQIDTLFGDASEEEAGDINNAEVFKPKKTGVSKIIPIVGILAIAGALGYYGYTKFLPAPPSNLPPAPDSGQTKVQQAPAKEKPAAQDAMPVETVENVELPDTTEEAAAVSIPAIEQNLDASILVSNLSVNWEVPSGYVSNNTAKRYFLKLGKIIQLNLKTELLLLNKPPITNKIALELEYDKSLKKFKVKGITASSGEKTVDDIITHTVEQALDMKLRMNTNSFSNITGNPVLVIHL